MGPAVEDVTFRQPGSEDAERTLDLMIRCDIDEYGELDSDMEDLLHDWAQIDVSRDAWLAFDPGGKLVGYAAVVPWGSDLRYDHYVEPAWQEPGLNRALLAQLEARAATLAADHGQDESTVGRLFIAHANETKQAMALEAGFQPGRYFFQMQIDLTEPPDEPPLPTAVTVRTFEPGADDITVYELIEAAFNLPGRTASSYESWRTAVFRPDIYDPDLWFLAEAGEEMVGACLCFAYPTIGWVRQLGVAEAWRRQGIGAALLGQAFMAFHRRGMDIVGLSVESERPDAYAFYQKLGMRRARQYDEFVKPLC